MRVLKHPGYCYLCGHSYFEHGDGQNTTYSCNCNEVDCRCEGFIDFPDRDFIVIVPDLKTA